MDFWRRRTRTSTRSAGPELITLVVPDYRKVRIGERLAALDHATIEDMQRLQYDVVSVQSRQLMPVFLNAMVDGPEKQRLAAWDFSYTPGSFEATLFSRLYRNVLLEIFGQEQGIGWRRMLYLVTRVGFSTMVLTCIDRLLLKDTSIWWQDRSKDELIRRAAERLSREPEQSWSVTNGFRFTSRFMESPLVGRAGIHHTRNGHARQPCYAVSRAPAQDGAARNDVCAVVSFRHRHVDRRSLDEFARRPEREPAVGLVQDRHSALAAGGIQAAQRKSAV